MRNGELNRRGRQLDPSWTGNMSIVMFAIAGGPHIETTYEWFPTKWPQSFGKIAGMSPILTRTFLRRGWHCVVIPAKVHAEGATGVFSARSMVTSDLIASRWGAAGEERGGRMLNSSVSCLCLQRGCWGVVDLDLTSQVTSKSHDTSRDSLFVLKHASDFTGRMFIKPNPLCMRW